jgi:hypothetical protein
VKIQRLLPFALALGTALAVSPAWPQTPPPSAPTVPPVVLEKPHYKIPKITTPIKIDGVLEDGEWSQALKIDVNVELKYAANSLAPVTTICYLAYDDKNLYAAFRANDPDPSKIRANLTDRDTAFRDDFVGLIFDTFNDERRGYELFVNPLGVQMDLALDETKQDNNNEEDPNWDTLWNSAGKIDDKGYVVEMAIPFSSLRFQRSQGEQTWGLVPYRSYPRSFKHQIVSLPTDPNNDCLVCQIPKVTGFEGATPGKNIELDPTATAHRTDERPDFPGGPIKGGKATGDLGITARWGITPNLTLSGAVNPDFSQVEADVAQLDVNTRFALFYPEKRPFFLEGAGFFDSPFNVVHTRTVAAPDWGVKLTGKEGQNAVGLFVAEDSLTNLLLPGSHASDAETLDTHTTDAALRYRRDLGATATLGGVVTHRGGDGGDAYHSDLYGIDGRWRPTASDVYTFQALRSNTRYPGAFATDFGLPRGTLDGSAERFTYNHSSRNWNWYARAEDVGREFRADLGFLPQVGYSSGIAGLERVWWSTQPGAWYSNITAGGDWNETRQYDGTVLQLYKEGYVIVRGPLQSIYQVTRGAQDRFWNGRTFHEKYTNFFFDLHPSGSLNVTLNASQADSIDFVHTRATDLLRLTPSVGLNVGRHLRLQLDHDLQREEIDGKKLLQTDISQMALVYQLNIRTFFRAILQYTDLQFSRLYTDPAPAERDKHLFSQLLFSYKLNPQTVFFLGYSDNQLGGQLGQDVTALTRSDRTVFAKIGYALVF